MHATHNKTNNQSVAGFARTAVSTAICTAIAGLTLASASAFAAAPMVKTAAPGFFRMMLGDFEVTAISDGTVDLDATKILHADGKKVQKEIDAAYLTTPTETSVNAYLINTGTKLVLIDTGAGVLFGPTLGRFAANLKAAGYQPEQIDEVYITHMHGDHLGGLVPAGAPAFPNAIVRADQHDADFWLSQEKMDAAPAAMKDFFKGAMASLTPYVKSNHFKPFNGATELVPGVKAQPAYGHTPGHTAYVVESGGKKLVLVGDMIHVQAVQMADPATTISFDSDAKAAKAQRLSTFAAVAKEGSLIGASHLQFPGIGHLRAKGKGFEWVPVNYTRMP